MTTARYLSTEDVDGLATIEEYVTATREAFRQVGHGAPARPRTKLEVTDPSGQLTAYVAILPETNVMGGYVYSSGFDAGDAWFLTPIFDATTGKPLAVLDGSAWNPLKTGAVGAVGTDALARPDARVLAIIGSGKQARGQLIAHLTVRAFDEIRVYSPTGTNRVAFADEFTDRLDIPVTPVASSGDAVREADVVVTATKARDPVFDSADLPDGAHVTAIGQYTPGRREVDADTIARSIYVPDLRDRALQDAGAFLHALEEGVVSTDHIHAELGDVVAGNTPGRASPDDVTVFDSGGTAIETAAAAHLLYQKAREADLGTMIEVTPASQSPLP